MKYQIQKMRLKKDRVCQKPGKISPLVHVREPLFSVDSNEHRAYLGYVHGKSVPKVTFYVDFEYGV